MKLYLRKDLANRVNELSMFYPVVTASNQGIIMMTTKEWSTVTDYITTFDSKFKELDIDLDFLDCASEWSTVTDYTTTFDSKFKELDIDLDFLDCASLWSECFCVYYNKDETKSFWGINSHETFVKVCRGLNVYPVVIPYDDIPWCFMKDFIHTENPDSAIFEAIEFIYN